MNSQTNREAVLALADGTIFRGTAIGAEGQSIGEVVFNTALTGYQEILTDPSYAHQIVTLTYPHIGNYGANPEDDESTQVHTSGLVIKNLPLTHSNFRADSDLSSYMKKNHCVAIADIDTRMLTRVLREKGSQNGAILALPEGASIGPESIQVAVDAAKGASQQMQKSHITSAADDTPRQRLKQSVKAWELQPSLPPSISAVKAAQ